VAEVEGLTGAMRWLRVRGFGYTAPFAARCGSALRSVLVVAVGVVEAITRTSWAWT
jgi:hypothetical protein